VVEKVQRGQQDQRRPGIKFALGHLGKEYNMQVNPQGVILSEADRFGTNRSAQSKDPYLSTNSSEHHHRGEKKNIASCTYPLIGVLRLRRHFALRSAGCAQDDSRGKNLTPA